MSSKREERLKDIQQNEDGRYEYVGEYYKMDDARGGSATWRRISVLLALLIAAVLASGLSESEAAIKAFYVILPYVGEVTALFILSWSVISVLAGRSRVRATVINKAAGKVVGGSTLLAVFALTGCIMSIAYAVSHDMSLSSFDTVAYPLLEFCAALLSLRLRTVYSGIKWSKVD